MINGRITKGVGGLYFVASEQGVFKCSARGIFRNRKIIPIIGDYVVIEQDTLKQDEASIVEIKKRRNELVRPKVSNVDQVIIVVAAINPTLNYDLLDKFIIMSEVQRLEIIICVSKMDLTEHKSISIMEDIYRKTGYKIIYCNSNDDSINQLSLIVQNKVSVFAGVSGVGKSTIVNKLIPSAKMQTGELSIKIKRGKNTTRHTELLQLNNNSFILDTPGFSSIDLSNINSCDLKYLFKEFDSLNDTCKYSDCNHINEPNCNVKNQIGISIHETRYNRYKIIYSQINDNASYY
jgi:ribosome biogenesis GTPase / thiamine phosphate phosphatase